MERETRLPLLFIGDSHTVGPFGRKLDALLRESGKWQVSTVAACGSSVSAWVNGGRALCGYFEKRFDGHTVDTNRPHSVTRVSTLIEELKPRVTLIALGSNDLSIPAYIEEAAVQQLIKQIRGQIRDSRSECVWIGPPDMRDFDPAQIRTYYELLKRVTAGGLCEILDSTEVTQYPATGGDGVHYNGPLGSRLAEIWAEEIFLRIQSFAESQ